MSRKVRILTTSFLPTSPWTVRDNLELASASIEAAGAERADLVCLPETFLEIGVPPEHRPVVEHLQGSVFEVLARGAKKHGVWVVAPCTVDVGAGRLENQAVVLNRQGELAGSYAKVHPTISESRGRQISAGREAVVIETDFGRLGLAICYDIGWPAVWARLGAMGAEIVVWPSAYDGGFPLRAYAWLHAYYIVSSVHTEHSQIIDITGQVLASTSRWHRFAAETIDLEKEIFHIDDQADRLYRIQKDLGHKVTVRAFTEEHIFTVESHDPDWPLSRIKETFGLENFRDYHGRASTVQERTRQPESVV